MTITPFLAAPPVPVAPDGGTTPDASGGDTGSGASAFGDTLAAALAGSLVVPATTAAAPAATPTPATPAPVEGGLRSAALPVPPAELAVRPVDVAAPSVELGVPSVESGVPSVESGVRLVDLGVRPVELAVPDPAPRRTTEGMSAGGLGSALAPADAGEVSIADVPTSTRENANSTDETADSIDPTAKSTGPTPGSTGAIPNSAMVTKAVVQQVFPEVTRVVSTVIAPAPGAPGGAGPANGTHRITLTLQPEQLGEVRVTLVVRDGAVHVRLAGGDGVEGAAVQRALAGEAPELQRILERTGADARVTVRDTFAPLLPSTTPSPQAGPDTDARSGAQARQDRQDGQDGRAAHEQPREQPRRDTPQRASYPIEPTPVAGRLDRTV